MDETGVMVMPAVIDQIEAEHVEVGCNGPRHPGKYKTCSLGSRPLNLRSEQERNYVTRRKMADKHGLDLTSH